MKCFWHLPIICRSFISRLPLNSIPFYINLISHLFNITLPFPHYSSTISIPNSTFTLLFSYSLLPYTFLSLHFSSRTVRPLYISLYPSLPLPFSPYTFLSLPFSSCIFHLHFPLPFSSLNLFPYPLFHLTLISSYPSLTHLSPGPSLFSFSSFTPSFPLPFSPLTPLSLPFFPVTLLSSYSSPFSLRSRYPFLPLPFSLHTLTLTFIPLTLLFPYPSLPLPFSPLPFSSPTCLSPYISLYPFLPLIFSSHTLSFTLPLSPLTLLFPYLLSPYSCLSHPFLPYSSLPSPFLFPSLSLQFSLLTLLFLYPSLPLPFSPLTLLPLPFYFLTLLWYYLSQTFCSLSISTLTQLYPYLSLSLPTSVLTYLYPYPHLFLLASAATLICPYPPLFLTLGHSPSLPLLANHITVFPIVLSYPITPSHNA